MKPQFLSGYPAEHALDCERLLVTLLRGLGPWRDSVYLIGGLAPRYIVKKRPPDVPPHAGTQDVDLVIDLQMLADIEAYQTLEENFKKLGFERGENAAHKKVSWRWTRKTGHGAMLILELLADDPEKGGGKVQELPTQGAVSALNVPHSSMVFEFYETVLIAAELLDDGGMFEARVRHADIVSFTCLKAFAFSDRAARKDAHDIVYCLEHCEGGVNAAGKLFTERQRSKHAAAMAKALEILRAHFATTKDIEGYRKDGPVAVARFEGADDDASDATQERRIRRQREASDVIERLLAAIGSFKPEEPPAVAAPAR